MHIRPKPNARKRCLTCKSVQLRALKSRGSRQDPKGKFGVSFRTPHPPAPLDAATLKKPNPKQNKHYFGSHEQAEGHSLFPPAVQITDSKCRRAEPKHVVQVLEEIPAPRAQTPIPRNLGGDRREDGVSQRLCWHIYLDAFYILPSPYH